MRIALPYQMIITPIDAYPMQHICGMPGSDSPGIRNITISLLIETDSVIQPESNVLWEFAFKTSKIRLC